MKRMRPRMNREQWAVVIEEQTQSGLSIEQFCQERDIGFASFGKWKRRLSTTNTDIKSGATHSPFKPVRLSDEPAQKADQQAASTVTLTLGAGMTLTIVNTTAQL